MALGQPSSGSYRLYRNTWRSINALLPKTQAAKVIYALMAYHFDGVLPEDGSMSKEAMAVFEMQANVDMAAKRRNDEL